MRDSGKQLKEAKSFKVPRTQRKLSLSVRCPIPFNEQTFLLTRRQVARSSAVQRQLQVRVLISSLLVSYAPDVTKAEV